MTLHDEIERLRHFAEEPNRTAMNRSLQYPSATGRILALEQELSRMRLALEEALDLLEQTAGPQAVCTCPEAGRDFSCPFHGYSTIRDSYSLGDPYPPSNTFPVFGYGAYWAGIAEHGLDAFGGWEEELQ